jgi:hypothetical protein
MYLRRCRKGSLAAALHALTSKADSADDTAIVFSTLA